MTLALIIFLSGMLGVLLGYLAGHSDGIEKGVTTTIGCFALAASKAEAIPQFKVLAKELNKLSTKEIKAAAEMAKEVMDDADSEES